MFRHTLNASCPSTVRRHLPPVSVRTLLSFNSSEVIKFRDETFDCAATIAWSLSFGMILMDSSKTNNKLIKHTVDVGR